MKWLDKYSFSLIFQKRFLRLILYNELIFDEEKKNTYIFFFSEAQTENKICILFVGENI